MEYLLKASGLATLLYLFYIVLLKNETFFKSIRFYFLIGLLLCVTIPLLEIPIYIEQTIQHFNNTIISSNSNLQNEASNTMDITSIFLYLYIIVAILLSVKFLIQLLSVGNLILKSERTKQNNYYLIETRKDISPFSFFNVIVYNPSNFSPEELDHIINHEIEHANQLHSLDTIFSHLLVILLWFNPFVWFYKKSVLQNLEFLADKYAISNSTNKKQYQLTLLKTSGINYCTEITNNFFNSLIKKRIVMLHKHPSNNKMQWKYALIIPMLAAFIFAFNTKTIAQKKESKWNIKISTVDLIIDKNSSDSELNSEKETFKKEFDIELSFKKIKRNSEGEITAIKIDAKSPTSNANFSVSGTKPIKPIMISFDNNSNSISIGNFEEKPTTYIYKVKDGDNVTWIEKDENDSDTNVEEIIIKEVDEDGKNVWIHKDDDNKHKKIKIIKSENGKTKVEVIKSDNFNIESENVNEIKKGENVFIIKTDHDINEKPTDKKENKIFISKSNGEPLVLVDGKEVSKDAMKKLDPDQIEKINVLKGKKAIEKYGEKAKDGVIEITTKN